MTPDLAGISKDGRANIWNVTCSCGKVFQPRDTILRWQTFDCPRCGKTYHADWNAPSVTEVP